MELLDEAKERCKGTIKERRGDDISDEELEESSSIMGYGAIKYADLKNNRKTDYKCAAADPRRRRSGLVPSLASSQWFPLEQIASIWMTK